MKRRRGLLLAILLAIVAYGVYKSYVTHKSHKITISGKTLTVDIAKTAEEREQGLSDREKMCSDCGLLFVFEKPGIYYFWMRRMYFDIDILWLAGDKVVDITFGAKMPLKEDFEAPKERYSSKAPVDKVLEVNAGWIERNKIKVGDEVKLD